MSIFTALDTTSLNGAQNTTAFALQLKVSEACPHMFPTHLRNFVQGKRVLYQMYKRD
jgi:hypothetical protein